MRIVQVSPLYESVPPKLYGGTERIVAFLTEALVAAGHEVTLFAAGDSETSAQLVPQGDRALRLDSETHDPVAAHLRMITDVYRRREEFDVAHFHVDYVHYAVSTFQSMPRLSTLHGRLDLPDLQAVYRTFPSEPVVSISNAQREPLSFANWIGTVYHGLPANLFSLGAGAGRYLVFLGRFTPDKGPHLAIEIARATGIPLIMAAKIDSEHVAYYENSIKPNIDGSLIQYVGEVGEGEKQELLGNALALLVPIDWPEPFGIVMIEAMACGTPVIAWRRGSVPEIIEDGVSGFVVDGIDEAIAAVSRVEQLDRSRCRASFEARFTADRMAHDYLQLYWRRLAANPARRQRSGQVGAGKR